MSEATAVPMSKADRLAVAGVVAPFIREGATSYSLRRVARIDANGNVVGYTTLAAVQKVLLERHKIEIAVQPGIRRMMSSIWRRGVLASDKNTVSSSGSVIARTSNQ
jgi:hypothetical protein